MSGVAGDLVGLMRPRREVSLSPPSTLKNVETFETSILVVVNERHRITKAGIKFASLTRKERNQFYKEVVDHVVDCTTKCITAFEASMRVALSYKIVVVNFECGRVKTTTNSRLVEANDLYNTSDSIITEAHAIASEEVVHVDEKRRRGATARRRNVERRQNADDDINNIRHVSHNDRSRAL